MLRAIHEWCATPVLTLAAVCATGRFQSRCRPARMPRDVLIIVGSGRPHLVVYHSHRERPVPTEAASGT